MALPAKKRPKSEKRKRATAHPFKKMHLISCPKCKKPIIPFHACLFCGTYKGKQILKLKLKKGKGRAKAKEDKNKK